MNMFPNMHTSTQFFLFIKYRNGAWRVLVFIVLDDNSLHVENLFQVIYKFQQIQILIIQDELYLMLFDKRFLCLLKLKGQVGGGGGFKPNADQRHDNSAYVYKGTGCSLNIVFFQDFEIYSRLCVSVCTLDFTLGPPDGRSNTSAAAELAEFRKFTTF